MSPSITIRRLAAAEADLMAEMMTMFGIVFEDMATYTGSRPDPGYHSELLANPHFIALCAFCDGKIIGGLTAYVLPKFEQARSEVYLYDLAVMAPYRRAGVATALIEDLKPVARQNGAWVIFVQADWADAVPVSLYSKLGQKEDVHHFDIPVN